MIRGLIIAILALFLVTPYANTQGKPEGGEAQPKPKAEQGTTGEKVPFPFFGLPQEKSTARLLKLSLEPKAVLKPDKSLIIEVTGSLENLTQKIFKEAKLTVALLAINQRIDFDNVEFTGKGEKEVIKRKGSFERKISTIAASGVQKFKVSIKTPPNTQKEGLQLALMGIIEAKSADKGEPTQTYSLVSLKDIKTEQ